MQNFIGGQRQKRPTTHLFKINQDEVELLRACVNWFIKEILEEDEIDD